MKRNLGVFTCYDIEYVFDYLGEDKINQRIRELENEKSGSMGINFNDFTYGDSENSYFNGKGVLDVFQTIMQWFDEIDLMAFLYEKSRKYNEENYYDSLLLNKKWTLYVDRQKSLLKKSGISYEHFDFKKNSYWTDYHFFYMHISKQIKKAFREIIDIERNFIGTYNIQKNKLIGEFILEVKTRRKPLTGKYLLYRDGEVWFNLEPKENNDSIELFHFSKSKNIYSLLINKEKEVATIELLELNTYSDSHTRQFRSLGIEKIWNEIIEEYTNNFSNISSSVKQTFYMVSDNIISNGIMWDIYDFYVQKNNNEQAERICKLNNSEPTIWRPIPNTKNESLSCSK